MLNINKKIRKQIKKMIEYQWHDLKDAEATEVFVYNLIKKIQMDYWKFLKEDVELSISKLLK